MADLDDPYIASLAEHARRGNSDAFAELYVTTCQKQYRFAYNYLKDEILAQDAIQAAYIFVLKNISALKDTALFLPWLNRTTFLACFRLQNTQAADRPEPEECVVRVDEHDFLIRQILKLPFTESEIIILRYYSHLKIRNIAGLMELSRRSVKKYLASGRRKLKLLLNDEKEKQDDISFF